ncbi:probable boi-related E3 ubiquitin-protein ligase 3 [Phtheirospermum japonicum]|uniref:Probable boi-related E3 ubiquitin-protein ligase 3 n=1 Tax=Phtheirospermum japonicum TaxID=374723 RepID=A0A830CV34_9LAMI|nr:probable boi-related E3 ubiquitin-protein ligase 3 [Phtheirospermum japonicum]
MIWYRDFGEANQYTNRNMSGNLGLCGSFTESMAVEARRLNLFSPKIHSNRWRYDDEWYDDDYGSLMGYEVVAPLSGTTTATETLVPMYGSTITEAFSAETVAIKSDSDLSYTVPVSRKCSRDAINSSRQNSAILNNHSGSLTFLGEDFSFQFQQQQLEIDHFIAQHVCFTIDHLFFNFWFILPELFINFAFYFVQQTEKVRLEVKERQKRYSRQIAAAVEDNVMKRLKAKEEEIEKMGKLNWTLEERVKSLCVENKIWRDLAQTSEATTNALRCNLEQVLAQV